MLNIHPSSRMRKILPGVNVVIAAYRHGSNERNWAYSNNRRHHTSTPQRTPVTNTYIKTYEHVILSNVASSLSQRPLRNATKQLRSLEQRATPQLTARNTFTLTAHETDTLPCDRRYCHSISSHSATNQLHFLERQRHASTSAFLMTVTHLPIYEGGSCRMSRRHCHSARREARPSKPRPLKPRATPRLPERSHIIYSA